MKDIKTEQLFSLLRWVFLIAIFAIYLIPYLREQIGFTGQSFPILVLTFFMFTVFAQFQLYKATKQQLLFPQLLQSGVWIDYGAFVWLVAITGGIESEFLPVMYIILMHAMIYWKERGAVLMTMALMMAIWSMPYFLNGYTPEVLISGALQTFILIVMAVFSAILVLQERRHLDKAAHLGNELRQDYLTGLYNVRHFDEELEQLVKRNEPFHLLIGDVDHFKVANDHYGHLYGDYVLERVGPMLKKVSGEHLGKAFRYGGEEFVFLFPGKEFNVERFLGDLCSEVEELDLQQPEWKLSMSVGYTIFKRNRSAEQVVAEADQRLYHAKRNGRACAVLEDEQVFHYLKAQ
ncbi:GGDEF domain-containing protein [Jeotgalibacillus sp. R-1-5s-1]|uniref:GGDEF domain-containing protein n=1 Tax=Jeotgalibacillus sp. R-1-5s-1 TaxID=2555897 RepID=UPI00141B1E43|nr:GGDEF domain-containing protein [Jeotgalibacillus sp. R-1-5s-1]